MRRLSEAVMTARGVLLEQYGHPHTWVRFDTPVRIVDARPRRNTPNYLGWARVDAEPGANGRVLVRWINETNFNRFYRKVQE
jgi:hypothetical protein